MKKIKQREVDIELSRYKFYMCSKCKFYIDEVCSKERLVKDCVKKNLKNKD